MKHDRDFVFRFPSDDGIEQTAGIRLSRGSGKPWGATIIYFRRAVKPTKKAQPVWEIWTSFTKGSVLDIERFVGRGSELSEIL